MNKRTTSKKNGTKNKRANERRETTYKISDRADEEAD